MPQVSTQILSALRPDPLTGSISTPIYQTATFVQEAPGVHKGFDYARTNNPTRLALENLVAELENAPRAFAFSTGLAAIDAVVKLLEVGDEILAVDDLYGGAYRLFTKVYSKFGISVRFVDSTDPANVAEAIGPRTKFLWIETPTNPTLKVTDIEAVCAIAQSKGVRVVVDNTFASPLVQKPLELGADLVVHSATKYLAGHSDLVAGIVAAKDPEVCDELKFIQNASGAVLGPHDSWLVIRGIETLDLRFAAQSRTALAIAEVLEAHPLVKTVHYPGLKGHKNHRIAAQQQGGQFGGVLSFDLIDDRLDAATAFVQATQYIHLAESLGGVKSLCCVPSEMTHKSIPREQRLRAGISDSLVRISCGIEGTEDLITDVLNALEASQLAVRSTTKELEHA